MAKVHKNLPAIKLGQGTQEKDPWEQWLDGRVWEIVKNEDFFIPLTSMTSLVHTAAKRYDLKVQTRTVGTSLFFQAIVNPNKPTKKGKS